LQCASAEAGTVSLGETASGSGSLCQAGNIYAQISPASPSYTIPFGGGKITQWSTATFGATAGTPITLLVLAPNVDATSYQVVGSDSEKIPTVFSLDNQVTYVPATPIEVPGGAVLGLWSSASGAECTSADATNVVNVGMSSAPTVGTTYTTAHGQSGRVNVSASLVQTIDAGLTGVAPAATTAGATAELRFSLTNSGTSSGGRIVVSDIVPSGLSIVTAASGSGSCTTSGQLVTCTVEQLAPGSSTQIAILVRTSAPGSFTDTATAAVSPLADSNTANNVASTKLTVTPARAGASSCHIVALKGLPLRTAKSLLRDLSCAIGKVSKKASKNVGKGKVVSTSPGSGSRPAGTKVAIVESSGKPKPRRKHHD
jgi:uncharacterized repeat protein (TIGR01451 family)